MGPRHAVVEHGGGGGIAVTDAQGVVSSDAAALAGLAGGSPIGGWTVRVRGGASISENAALKLDRLYNIQLGIEYGYAYVDEVI